MKATFCTCNWILDEDEERQNMSAGGWEGVVALCRWFCVMRGAFCMKEILSEKRRRGRKLAWVASSELGHESYGGQAQGRQRRFHWIWLDCGLNYSWNLILGEIQLPLSMDLLSMWLKLTRTKSYLKGALCWLLSQVPGELWAGKNPSRDSNTAIFSS